MQRGMLTKLLKKHGYRGKTKRWPELKQDNVNIHARSQKLCGAFCDVCRSTDDLHVHHKIPVGFGGNNDKGNLQTLCRTCHIKAHRKLRNALKELVEKYILEFVERLEQQTNEV
jgi:5-methylcytosine-specific restriction endonuclease McrA